MPVPSPAAAGAGRPVAPGTVRPRPEGRLLWVDVAKGACILLVVLHHAVVKDLPLQAAPALESALEPALEPVVDAWLWVTMALKPVRMPLFFVLSGLVASGAVRRPWAQARRRVLSPYYLYVVWLVLQGAFFSVERLLPMNRTQDLGELVADLVLASTGLWFLYALAVYFALARLLAGLPVLPVLAVSAVVSACAGLLPTDDWNRVSVVFHFTFCALGALAPELVRRWAGPASRVPRRLALVYLALVVFLPLLGVPRTTVMLLAGLVGVPLGLGVSVLLAEGRAAAGLAWVGRRTLPIYVLHAPLLALALHLPSPIGTGRLGAIEAAAYPVLLTAVAVTAALALHALLRRMGADMLFELPRRPAHATRARVPGTRGAGPQATVAASS